MTRHRRQVNSGLIPVGGFASTALSEFGELSKFYFILTQYLLGKK